jgi:hypothetical protein
MVAVVKLLGIFIVGFGVASFVNPNVVKQFMGFWKPVKRIYLGGTLSLVLGIIFLLAASQCRWRGFIIAFGILFIARGICVLVIGQKRVISVLDWWLKKPVKFLRGYAVFAIILGTLFIYSV